MTRPRNIRSILGTEDGDKFLSHPASANDLYRSLVGHPMRDSIDTACGAEQRGEDPWDVFDPLPQIEQKGPLRVESERIYGRDAYDHHTAELFSSRDHTPGVGYPSCCRALARIAKICHDVNGYYRRIGVPPTATKQQIRRALATLYRRYHPDTGWSRDTDEFQYLREIAAVLLSEKRRARYDNLARGEKWLDSRVKAQLNMNDPIVTEHLRKCDEQQERMDGAGRFSRVRIDEEEVVKEGSLGDGGIFREDRQQAMARADVASGNDHYDWFSDGERYGDRARAQLWYLHLVKVAPIFRFTRPIRVWLTEVGDPEWSEIGGILRIPRAWPIGSAEAFSLFTCVVQ